MYFIVEELDPLNWDLDTYYDDAEGLTGEQLLSALRTIVNTGFIGINYGDSRYILDDTDADPNIPGNVILVYRQTSVDGTWDEGSTWNREHVWPQSLLGTDVANSTISIGTDLHNLKPANPSENSSRGNEYFDNIDTGSTYEPPDEVKGDIARILFYMIVMYDYLNLVDDVPELHEMALLGVLLSWHEADPVDAFEENRNEVIYSYQNNRNPFIDYPHFVEMIFENHVYYN
ncbi:MAG: endonuclease [Candidatus Izemoplasmatales bacterium]